MAQLGPGDVIGREGFIRQLWQVLETRSLILSAERRFGKTSIIQKMVSEAPSTVLAFYQDVGAVQTAQQFCDKVFDAVKKDLGTWQSMTRQVGRGMTRLPGAKINVKPPRLGPDVPDISFDLPTLTAAPWKTELSEVITALVVGQPGRVIFFWDEVPWMIENIIRNEGEGVARELLDVLRALRQDPQLKDKLRMVYTGSIGFHHVIASPPINDMRHEEVLPLDPEDARTLAGLLLDDADVSVMDRDATTKAVAEAADNIPFYIKTLVECFYQAEQPVGPDDIQAQVRATLEQAPEHWDLPHYDIRIDQYYTEAQRPFARDLLDILAGVEPVADFDTLFNLLKSRRATEDADLAHTVLGLLRQDHYIRVNPYRFRQPLICRFWRLRRGIERIGQ